MKLSQKRQLYRDAANALRSSNNEEIQVDLGARVSMGSEKGAYVQAWVWVTDEEAGIPEPEKEES